MSRTFYIRDDNGERQLPESAAPFRLGGAPDADIVLSDLPNTTVVATIAYSEGHPFVQPEGSTLVVYHNHERLQDSAWLKSGDSLEVDETTIDWQVKGDQVFITVGKRNHAREPIPPRGAPPGTLDIGATPANDLPVNLPQAASGGLSATGKWLVVLFSVLLVAAASFVLLATPVQLDITPVPNQQSLRGEIPTLPVWGRVLALPGEYVVNAEHTGYKPLSETITVTSGGTSRFAFQLQELPGEVSLKIIPETPFRLLVDGVETAVDEGTVKIKRGRRLLRVETERYLPLELESEITGLGEHQQLEFELKPAWAEVSISSAPPGAEVTADGVVLGSTPLQSEIMQGSHTLILTLADFKPLTLSLEVTAGQSLQYDNIELQPLDGRLELESTPTAATVTVNGEFRGTTPLTLTLSSGQPHTVRLSKAGYQDLTRKEQLGADEERRENLTLKPVYGIVFLRSQPADAQLLVDGKPIGNATRRLKLPVRSHELEIRKIGYVSQKISVTPRFGDSQSIEIELKPTNRSEEPLPISAPSSASKTDKQAPSGDGFSLQLIRPGEPFVMGASRREAGRRANETLREVTLTRPYYLASTEITNTEYRQFKPEHRSGSTDGVTLDGDRQPVVNVSWDDAARYCNWLSRKADLPPVYRDQGGRMELILPILTGYRLPTEAEWAYAARFQGRSKATRYPWSGDYPPRVVVGNYADRQLADTLADIVPGYDDGYRGTAPVGSYAPSPPGFYDLGGNVAEWTNDFYEANSGSGNSSSRDPLGPPSGSHHVVRGSGWRHGNITELRFSYRDYSKQPRPDLGFRLARYAQ